MYGYRLWALFQQLIALSVFSIIALPVSAAGIVLPEEPILTSPVTTPLSTKQGLAQDSINQLFIDHDGFLWVASDGGLDRYDGYRVEHVQGPDGVLASTPVNAVFQDSSRQLWISTASRGVYKLDLTTNTYSAVLQLKYINNPEYQQLVNKFIELPDGNMLMLFEQMLIHYDTSTQQQTILYAIDTEKQNNVPYLRDLLLIDKTLVMATSSGMFVANVDFGEPVSKLRFLPVEHRADVEFNLDNLNAKSLMTDSFGRLWIGTVAGLYSMPVQNLQQAVRAENRFVADTRLEIAERNIWQIKQANDSLVWLGTDIGLVRMQMKKGRWHAEYALDPATGLEALSRQDIRALALAPNDGLWIGTYIGGAFYWSPQSLNFTMLQNQRYSTNTTVLSDNNIWALYEDTDGTLWIGTDNGLTRYDPVAKSSIFYLQSEGTPPPYSMHIIQRIYPLREDVLLLQTYAGLYEFRKSTGDVKLLTFGRGEDEATFMTGLAKDAEGNAYFLGDNFYKYDFKAQKLEELTDLNRQISLNLSTNFIGINPVNASQMLLATFDGLWAYDIVTKKAERLHQLPDMVRHSDFAPDSVLLHNNILWVVYPGYGLVGLDVQNYQQRYYFGSDILGKGAFIYGLLEDKDNNIWFSSHSGLQRFSPDKLTFKRFQYGRELNVAEFNQGANVKLQDGRIAYGSPRGVVMFDPNVINAEYQKAVLQRNAKQLVISGISLSSRNLGLPKQNLAGRHIALQHDDYGLTIEFSPLEFSAQKDTRFRYVLSSGKQVLSEDTTFDTKVVLPSLPAGNYRFEVMPAGQYSDQTILPVSLTIQVDYPPFLSPLAYTLYALCFITLLGAYLVSRHLQLVRLQQAQQQVKLFGNAFRHTSDWVVIFDQHHRAVAANPAFESAFGITDKDRLDRQLQRLYQQDPKLERQLAGQLRLLKTDDVWKGEDSIVMPDGRKYDVLIDINVMQGTAKDNETTHYLVVISDISEQKNAERKLVKIANFDNLTGLVNRSLLLDRLEHAIANAVTHEHTVAVLFVDLDRFKGINDSLGHDYGDKLLRVIANRMLNLASKSDTVARLGGDEFVIVMEEVDNEASVSSFVSQLIESIETPISLGKEVLRVSCSVGISFFPDDATDPAELLKQADVAMYSAKKDTLSAFIYYTKEMNERAKERLALENRVKSAYQEQAFINYYQPIINISSGQTEGVELLLRCHYQDEWISPADFIPVLEEMRHIIEITRVATTQAVNDMKQWYAQGFKGYVSINLSALHFKTHFDLDLIEQLLRDAGLPNSSIRFEITEGVLIDQSDEVLNQLTRIRDAGFKLALDDFGTGYSSLSYLKRFPLQILKIDKSFIDDIQESKEENALVQTTINLALSLKMDCIAEGIEHSEQVQYLLNQGCVRLQGYYFSKPVDAITVAPLLLKQWREPSDSFTPSI